MFIGDDADIRRWTVGVPWPDTVRIENKDIFGSAHAGGCHFAFCDGSVRTISYTIDPRIHRLLGARQDGEPVSDTAF